MSVLDGPGEGTWSVFALKVAEERDQLREEIAEMKLRVEEADALFRHKEAEIRRLVAEQARMQERVNEVEQHNRVVYEAHMRATYAADRETTLLKELKQMNANQAAREAAFKEMITTVAQLALAPVTNEIKDENGESLTPAALLLSIEERKELLQLRKLHKKRSVR